MSLWAGFVLGLVGAIAADIAARLLQAREQARHLEEAKAMSRVLAEHAARLAQEKRVYIRYSHTILRQINDALEGGPPVCAATVRAHMNRIGGLIAAQEVSDVLARQGVPVPMKEKESVE